MTNPQVNGGSEPVLRPINVDMSTTNERNIIKQGEPVYTLFVRRLAPGTTLFQVNINGQWLDLDEGDTVFCGDCNPTVIPGVLVRTAPALPNLFSLLIIGGTPDTGINLK